MTIDDKPQTKWVVWRGNQSISVSGNTVSLGHNGRFYLANQDQSEFSSDMFYNPDLLGSSLSYDVDIS